MPVFECGRWLVGTDDYVGVGIIEVLEVGVNWDLVAVDGAEEFVRDDVFGIGILDDLLEIGIAVGFLVDGEALVLVDWYKAMVLEYRVLEGNID